MWKLVIPALAAALTGCGGGAGSGGSAIQALNLDPIIISRYKNEIESSQVFNSAVADLNGDGLDDIVLSGWAVAQNTHVGSRSGFINLKIFIQQDNGSLIDKTSDLIGDTNSTIWGSQRVLINDYDNDGRPDIAVLGFQDGQASAPAPSVVFWNNGNSFSRLDLSEKIWAHAACSGDLNGDGLLELVTGSADTRQNTIYANQGQRQFILNANVTQESISSAGTCAVIKDSQTGNIAIITTNMPFYPFYNAIVKIWDKNFKFIKASGLPGSEELGANPTPDHDIVNVVPIDVNGDGLTDLITTDNGDFTASSAKGFLSVLINQGNFVYKNETDAYLPNQTKNSFFNYYYNKLAIDGYQSVYFDHSGTVSLWQFKNRSLVKYKEELLNSLVSGYQYTNIYKTKNGHSLFLVNTTEYPYATFYYRPIPTN